MLQFISHYTERYSYLDSIRLALEGGCRWIQLRMKDIYRHIDGVIKAEDAAVLRNELEEFVITDEIRVNLETFFENYNDGNSNGAWALC